MIQLLGRALLMWVAMMLTATGWAQDAERYSLNSRLSFLDDPCNRLSLAEALQSDQL